MFRRLLILLPLFSPLAGWAAGQFDILLNAGPQLSANPAALAAFERAAGEWEASIDNPVTIHVNAELAFDDGTGQLFPTGVIGFSAALAYGSNGLNLSYDLVRTAMAARASQPGLELLAFLPTSATLQAGTPSAGQFESSTISVPRANQRVLGLLPETDTRADAEIRFNSAFSFDFDRTDGVAAGKTDFQTVAAHEIGHMLGFVSNVDDFDSTPMLTSDNLSTLDLFRFPVSHQPTSLLEFATFARTLKPGEESVFSDLALSYRFSTGTHLGDARQASHWKDDALLQGGSAIGIMDPTLARGTFHEVAASDLRALEVIGYNVIPEPSTSLLICAGALALGRRRSHG